MGGFGVIDLSKLPPPDVVEQLDFEATLAARLADVVTRFQASGADAAAVTALEATIALESEPIRKLAQAGAYREQLLRTRINQAARACLVATATGADLDQLGALAGVTRLVATPATDDTPAALEADDPFRRRIITAPDAWEGAGSAAAIDFHARTADARVKHVGLQKSSGAEITVSILSSEGDGAAAEDLLTAVRTRLLRDDVKLMTDVISVRSAAIQSYAIGAHLKVPSGVDASLIQAQAETQLAAMAAERHAIGRNVPLSAITGAAHVAGVEETRVTSPAADVMTDAVTAPHASAITVTTEIVHV